MLQSISINNFKGIRSLELKKISRLTIIGGKNNCGKSSLMEAMAMLFNRMDPHIVIRQSIARGVSVIPGEPEFMWAPIFNNFDLKNKIEIGSKFSGKSKKLKIEVLNNFKRTIPVKLTQTDVTQNSTTVVSDALSLIFLDDNKPTEKSTLTIDQGGFNLNIEHSQGKRLPTAYFSARQQSNQNEDSERLGRIDINNNIDNILDVIRSIAPEIKAITSIRIANASMIYVDIGKDKKVPISYMGDGISRLLSITLAIASCNDGIVFIDEVENGLHYSVMSDIWHGIMKASYAFNCQVIATTHSHEFLSSSCSAVKRFNQSNIDFSYIRLYKNNDETSGKIFDHELLDYAVESEVEVR